MHGKLIVFIGICTILLGACTNSENKVLHTKDFNFTMPEVQEFTNPKEDDITEKSIPVGCTMIPSKLTNNGILIGTENHSIKGYDLNKTREEILYTMQSESAFDTLGILAASDDYMIFCEIIDSKNYKYYAYEFSSKKTSLIKESKDLSALVTDEAIIHKDKAYLFLCDKTNDEQEYTYNGYIYDFKTGELDLFENEKLASFPAMLNDRLYYLQIDNKGLTTTLIQYSPEKDEKRILLDGNLHDGYISELKSDGKQLYVFVSKENGKTYCFRYQPDKGEIKPYIVMDSTDGLTVSERFMTWINWSKPDDRMHTMYYMLDIENNLLYKYEGSEIVQADNQMIWTKFLKKENSIPKGEIFQKGNSQLMWFKF